MRQKRFSLLQLFLAAALTAAVVLAGGALLLSQLMGSGGRSLVEALHLINTRFVGEYDEEAVIDGALEGMVNALGDRWSYTLTADELAAQNQRRTNQYVGIGVTVSYEREEGLEILEVAAGGPAEEAGLLAGEVITAVDGTSLAGRGGCMAPRRLVLNVLFSLLYPLRARRARLAVRRGGGFPPGVFYAIIF